MFFKSVYAVLMSYKRPKGIFQDRHNKPDSAIPPFNERLFYKLFRKLQSVSIRPKSTDVVALA